MNSERKMERLTEKHWRNLDPWECCGQDNYCQRGCHNQGGCANGCVVPKIYCRLARYEDAEEQGLLLRLPFPIGTTVYIITAVVSRGYPNPKIEEVIREEKFSYEHIEISPRYLFSTYAEAEAALKKRKEEYKYANSWL